MRWAMAKTRLSCFAFKLDSANGLALAKWMHPLQKCRLPNTTNFVQALQTIRKAGIFARNMRRNLGKCMQRRQNPARIEHRIYPWKQRPKSFHRLWSIAPTRRLPLCSPRDRCMQRECIERVLPKRKHASLLYPVTKACKAFKADFFEFTQC